MKKKKFFAALLAAILSFTLLCPVTAEAASKKPAKVTLSSAKSNAPGSVTVTYKKAKKATGYQILFATDKKFKKNKKTVNSAKLAVTKTGLKKGTAYYVKVRAVNKVKKKKYYGAYSKVRSVKTLKTVTVGTAKISSVTTTKRSDSQSNINVSWGAVANAQAYQVQYSTTSKFASGVATRTVKTVKDTYAGTPGKTYYVRVRGVNNTYKVYGKWSGTKSIKSYKETHQHSYTKSVVTAPSCTTAGRYRYTCSCGDSYTETVAAPGHDYVRSVVTPATCSTEGRSRYTCSRCKDTYYMKIRKRAHTYAWTVTKQPTETEYGEKSYQCTKCGDVSKTEQIDKLPATVTYDPSKPFVESVEAEFHYRDFTATGYITPGSKVVAKIKNLDVSDETTSDPETGYYSITLSDSDRTNLVLKYPVVITAYDSSNKVIKTETRFACKEDEQIDAVYNNMLKGTGITNSTSDIKKAYLVATWLCSYAEYEHDYEESDDPNIYSPYGLISGRMVCAGYAYAYEYLMNRVGVECRYVDKMSEDHAWNQVKINGEWYHVDVTLMDEDSSNTIGYWCFVKSAKFISSSNDQGYTTTSNTKYDDLREKAQWEQYFKDNNL